MSALVTAGLLLLSPAPDASTLDPLPQTPEPPVIQNEDNGSTCHDIEANCEKVRRVIRDVFGPHADWAISCFSSESGLFKWSNHPEKDPEARETQYMGIAQMGASERQQTDWGWEVRQQIKAAYRWFKAAGSDAWMASGC